MGDMGNTWQMGDYLNAKYAWIGQMAKSHRMVNVYKFQEYAVEGNQTSFSETIRVPVYNKRTDHAWIDMVKVFDTVRGGYFTTGDIHVNTEYALQGYSAGYTSTDGGVNIPEYAGDLIEWNGKLWAVADVLEPVQWGYLAKQVFFVTVMRKTQVTNISVRIGP